MVIKKGTKLCITAKWAAPFPIVRGCHCSIRLPLCLGSSESKHLCVCTYTILGMIATFIAVIFTSDSHNFFFFFNSVLRPFQDYFSSYETGQSVGGAKTAEPREKPPGTPASRTWLVSRGQSGARTHTRHSSEMIE